MKRKKLLVNEAKAFLASGFKDEQRLKEIYGAEFVEKCKTWNYALPPSYVNFNERNNDSLILISTLLEDMGEIKESRKLERFHNDVGAKIENIIILANFPMRADTLLGMIEHQAELQQLAERGDCFKNLAALCVSAANTLTPRLQEIEQKLYANKLEDTVFIAASYGSAPQIMEHIKDVINHLPILASGYREMQQSYDDNLGKKVAEIADIRRN